MVAMTTEEKRKAIIQRISVLDDTFTNQHISFILILAYLRDLAKEGIISGGQYALSNIGGDAVAICEEFDWKPTDADIDLFLTEAVIQDDVPTFKYYLTEYRDNRSELLGKIKRFKGEQNY